MRPFNPKSRTFTDHDHDAYNKAWPWAMERLTPDRGWVATAKVSGIDDDRLDRHAELIGGRVRLVLRRTGEAVTEWVDGVRVALGEAAE